MNYTINYVRKVPVWRKIIGIAALIVGIIELVLFSVFGLIRITFSFVLLRTDGSEINLESKTYRKINTFLGLKIGKWQPLPEVEYVSVFATNETSSLWVSSASTNITESIYAINLFYDRNKKIEANVTLNKKDAFDVALHLADALEVDMLDATVTGDFKWMDKDAYRDKDQFVYI